MPAAIWGLVDLDHGLVTALLYMDGVIIHLALHRGWLVPVAVIAGPWVVYPVTPCCTRLGTCWPIAAGHRHSYSRFWEVRIKLLLLYGNGAIPQGLDLAQTKNCQVRKVYESNPLGTLLTNAKPSASRSSKPRRETWSIALSANQQQRWGIYLSILW